MLATRGGHQRRTGTGSREARPLPKPKGLLLLYAPQYSRERAQGGHQVRRGGRAIELVCLADLAGTGRDKR